jgi:multiple sugar transport system permease protein
MSITRTLKKWGTPRSYMSLHTWQILGTGLLNFLVYSLLVFYLLPLVYMTFTAFMEDAQLGASDAPIYPARLVKFNYGGKANPVYYVPIAGPEGETIKQLALVKAGRTSSQFIDPQNPQAGLIDWEGSWRALKGVYRFHITLENFTQLWQVIKFPQMARNTLLMALISEVGVVISSIVVAYGFSRFPLPGGNLLFYILIASILIPDKITLIPSYILYVRYLDWNGTWLPLLVPFFFGSAVYIFLLRQNFRSIPREMDEAAMLDGAGPLRILYSIILPQSWPVVITMTILHFFYMWNETRQAALYLSIRRDLAPLSFAVQNYQSLAPITNTLEASALLVILIPIVVLLISQRYFMQDVLVTGTER